VAAADSKSDPAARRIPSWVLLFASLALAALAVWFLQSKGGATRQAAWMGGIFVLAAMLWVSEALPLFATSLLVIGLQIVLLANPGGWAGLGFESGASPSYRDILSTAADPVLVLFFGGFVLARAAVKERVDQAMSALLLRPFGHKPRHVLLGVMLVTLLFGMWMSNTATTAMMLAVMTPMLAALPPREPFRKALVLAVPFTANISGVATPIASPPNAVAIGFLQQEGHTIPFLNWMLMAAPLALGLTLVTWLVLWHFHAPATPALRIEHAADSLTSRGWLVVGVFVVTVLLWMSDQWHGLPPAVVALLPAVVLTTTSVFKREDLGLIEWNVLILIAGGISLGIGMQLTGLDHVVVRWLPVTGENPFALFAVLVLATLIVGTFMSNTAAANLFLPIGLSASATAGAAGGLHPIHVALSIALIASMGMALPVSTPPNAMAYARNEFTTRDMVRVSLLISGLGAVAIIAGGEWIMRLAGILE
jgi:solute carrier family 13 (sodium-dependent dicarboxylate transporter), member 2/3/5